MGPVRKLRENYCVLGLKKINQLVQSLGELTFKINEKIPFQCSVLFGNVYSEKDPWLEFFSPLECCQMFVPLVLFMESYCVHKHNGEG